MYACRISGTDILPSTPTGRLLHLHTRTNANTYPHTQANGGAPKSILLATQLKHAPPQEEAKGNSSADLH